ncbi:MAG: glycoside hydrolase family 127 protein, partial [Proteobacteria bacterium]|nr:glycoside hydrolase family 127 protein [Pseudomonadota bacterium]
YVEGEDFRGYDPYDALNSPLLRFLSHNSKYLRILFIQTLKRLPFNLRPVLGIRKELNPKGLGLFLWGYAKLYGAEKEQRYLTTISHLLDLLEHTRSNGYFGNCWGYNFDWQSRAFYVPKYTPTVVNSSFIGHALLDTYKYTGHERALEMALSIKDFILNDLNRLENGNKICFSYTPVDHYFVHNANLLGASILIRLYKYTGESALKDAAFASLGYTMNHQREDGSWFYAERERAHWIDSFHTGFNLQSILYFIEEGFADEYLTDFNKGVCFYRDHFFLKDGTPKYYHNKTYPIDIHAPAQALVFFSRLGGKYTSLAEKILDWMVLHMRNKKGYFYFQKHPFYTNKIPYMRWGQAWAFHALTEYYLTE